MFFFVSLLYNLILYLISTELCSFLFHLILGFGKTKYGYLLLSEYAAEGLEIGNSVYWIRFGEEHSQKVILVLLLQYQNF